jgi:hypothetical protein
MRANFSMARRNFITVRELIYWEYAKLISGSAIGNRKEYGFVNSMFRRMIDGQMTPSSILRENKQLFSLGDVCAYCGSKGPLYWEHIVPVAICGPDIIDNIVRACALCNLEKGARDPYQWYSMKNEMGSIPRLVLGKFLKVVFDEYSVRDLLDSQEFMRSHSVDRLSLSAIFSLECE